jgi:predicted phage terminase large subunit-like protein
MNHGIRKQISPVDLAKIDTNFKYTSPKHISELNRLLLQINEGKLSRLAVFMPPRHGKSELISKYFPAYYLATHPDNRVILASYEADFAATWGSKARDILKEHGHSFENNITLDDRSAARNRFGIKDHQGGMITSGVGGPITGKGADLLIIDDPIKNSEEANSQIYRDKILEWYKSTAYTRLEPNGAIILIMTRWHESDLAGMILANSKEDWTILKLPAIAEDNDLIGRKPGDALWPERFNYKRLQEIKTELGDYLFSAMYQQRPQPAGGGILKQKWIKYYQPEELPPLEELNIYQAWDLAISTKETADYTVCTTIGVLDETKIYVLDWYRDRINFPTQLKMVEKLADDWNPLQIGIESNAYQTALPQQLKETSMLPVKEINQTKDKVTRIQSGLIYFEQGKILLPKKHPELQNFINEYVYFPKGKHDDMLDSMELAIQPPKDHYYNMDPYLIVGSQDY